MLHREVWRRINGKKHFARAPQQLVDPQQYERSQARPQLLPWQRKKFANAPDPQVGQRREQIWRQAESGQREWR